MSKKEETPLHFAPSFLTHIQELQQQGRAQIAEIVAHADPVELFVATLSVNMFAPPDAHSEGKFGSSSVKSELLAYELFPHFPGPPHQPTTVVKKGATDGQQVAEPVERTWSTVLPQDTLNCLDAIEKLLIGRSFRRINDTSDDVVRTTKNNAEIIRGNGYVFQTERRIREIQGRFDRWYGRRLALTPSRAVDLVNAIALTQENAFNERVLPKLQGLSSELLRDWKIARKTPIRERSDIQKYLSDIYLSDIKTAAQARSLGAIQGYNEATPKYLPVRREDIKASEEEWAALLRLVGFSKAERLNISDPIEVRRRPLFVLPDGRVLVVDISNTLDSLWDSFDEIARADQKFYNRDYQDHAADWVEDRTLSHLSRIFSTDSVYRTLDYANPAAGADANAELDAAVAWGPFLILVEAKAKQFRLAGQLGDVGRLRTDVQRNVEDAFVQARRARAYIESVDRAVLRERNTGRTLVVEKSSLRRIFLFTVSLHRLAFVTTQLSSLGPLGLFRGNEFPFAIGEVDLEVISENCPGPDVFLHYIEKRLDVHRTRSKVSADELDLFGAYLDTRFVSGQLWDAPESGFDGFFLGGYSDTFDRWAFHRWRAVGTPPEIKLRVPEEVAAALAQLRRSPSNDERWIAFCVLNLEPKALDYLAQAFCAARKNPPELGGSRRFVVSGNGLVLCVVVASNCSQSKLRENLERRISIEKYRRNASLALGFGVIAEEQHQSFSVAILREGTWEPDSQMDRMTEEDSPVLPLPGMKIPGRNEPCFCGSGQKFKRCCAVKVAQARRKSME